MDSRGHDRVISVLADGVADKFADQPEDFILQVLSQFSLEPDPNSDKVTQRLSSDEDVRFVSLKVSENSELSARFLLTILDDAGFIQSELIERSKVSPFFRVQFFNEREASLVDLHARSSAT